MTEAERLLKLFEADPSQYDRDLLRALGIQSPDDWDLTNKHGIADANSCGQGFDRRHEENPFLELFTKHGYRYSHTTPVNRRGQYENHHCYKHAILGPDFNASAFKGPRGWQWEISKSASGYSTGGDSAARLDSYLKNYLRRQYSQKRRDV